MRSSTAARKLTAATIAVVALGLAAPAIASADVTYTVDSGAADSPLATPGSTACVDQETPTPRCSLRAAVQAADNNTSGTVTINFSAPGTYTLTQGELVLDSPATVVIDGAGSVTINAFNNSRAFDISSGTVTISALTITDGRSPSISGWQGTTCPSIAPTTASPGGAILDDGTLTLTNDTFTGNMSSGNGGAIEQGAFNHSLTITGSTFTGNTACQPSPSSFPTGVGTGGAIDEAGGGPVTIDSSTISTNVAQGDGGGIGESFPGDPATVTVTNTTISGNHADGDGGGIAGEGAGSISLFADLLTANTATGNGGGIGGNDTDQITNSTITDNFAGCSTTAVDCDGQGNISTGGNGGGIENAGGPVTISFSTINDNNAEGGSGGNLANDDSASYTLDDSIIAGGIADSSPENCTGGGFTSNGHNLFDDGGTNCGGPGTGDVTNASPNLGALANNGGPTETEALLAGSPAIDAADNSLCTKETSNGGGPVDQRGVTRPQGSRCDIGAYEAPSKGGGGGGKATGTIVTTVFDAATHAAWTGNETAGASAYDTTNLGGTIAGQTPTGSVTYSLFDNASCSGTAASTDTEPLNSDGSVPNSKPSGPLAAGAHSYQASWGGDVNYNASTGPCEPFTVQAGQADLHLTASPDSNPIVVGEQDTVTDTITNAGGSAATNVQFTDPSAGFTISSVTPSQGTCAHTATTVSCSLGTVGAGHHATVQILLTATSAGTITLHSSVSMAQTDPTPGNDHATTTIRVNPHVKPGADLAVAVTSSADRVPVGHTFVYTLTVSNRGPDAGNQVAVTNTLPGNVSLVSIRSGRSQCHMVNTMTCSLGTLRRGATRRIHLVVRAQDAGLALDKAQVTDASPTDPNLRNNRDRATVTLVAQSLPTVGVIHLGASCHSESSTIRIRAVAFSSAGIKQVSIAITGHGIGKGIAAAPPTGKTVHRFRFGTTIKAASLLAGRTYRVLATVTDRLGRRSQSTAHFTVCNPPHKRGFTG